MTGLLAIDGSVNVSQFWPEGDSDADTVKFEIADPQIAFTFRASPGAKRVNTKAFTKAGMFETVQGSKTFKPLIRNGAITLRLQGIDAPELHVPPRVKGGKDFREFQGETSTVALHKRLSQEGKNIQCQFLTAVNHPQDVVDKYGRFVGEIVFNRNTSQEWNICDWLAEQGWAFPAFYTSMSVAEIQRIQNEAASAQKAERGIWHYLSSTVGPLDWNMVYRKHGQVDPAADQGPVVFPKLFRRLCDYSERKHNGSIKGSFKTYLAGLKPPDPCYHTADFLAAGGKPSKNLAKHLPDFVTANDKFTVGPGDLVFEEAEATIVDKNNNKITQW